MKSIRYLFLEEYVKHKSPKFRVFEWSNEHLYRFCDYQCPFCPISHKCHKSINLISKDDLKK